MARTGLAAALLIAHACASVLREEVPFSNAWRFHFGPGVDDAPGPGNNWSFPTPIVNCSGMYHNPNRFTSSDCEVACAYDQECLAWIQYSTSCYHAGENASCVRASPADAQGALRAAPTPVQTSYGFAAAELPGDSAWPIVDAPHDGLMSLNNSFSNVTGDQRHGYRTRTVLWYRKHFRLPADWNPADGSGALIFLRFDGVVHVAQLWLNGAYLASAMHTSSYGAFTVRLDNVSAAVWGGANVLAIRADASFGSEHWYGGGGITRAVTLVRAPPQSFVESGVFVVPELSADADVTTASAEWQDLTGSGTQAYVRFDVRDPSGSVVASNSTVPASAPPGGTVVSGPIQLRFTPGALQLWGTASAPLYTVTATLVLASSGVTADAFNASVGFRRTRWDGATGFWLNGKSLKQRGFSHHNSFAGVGVAMPQRLDLFRVQCARSVGANIWRMSHNPYRSGLYDLLDTLGMMSWNENRDFGEEYVFQMHDMAKRDRNHPSVIINSLCNEYECLNTPETGIDFVAASKAIDPSRPTTANSNNNDGLSAVVDVQGHSHSPNKTFIQGHEANPAQPLVLSECCSCTSSRVPRDPVDAACISKENSPMFLPYVTGSLGVWTLFDYFGEPPGPWPYVSSTFGQFDLAGSPKPNAYWYSANWRELVASSDPGKVPLPAEPVVRITDLLDALNNSTINGIASTATAELLIDGVSVGVQQAAGSPVAWAVRPPPSSCVWPTNLSGVQCKGLVYFPAPTHAAACEAAACAADALVWQWAPEPGCWAGTPNELPCVPPTKPNPWVGGGRPVAWAPSHNATLLGRNASGAVVASHTVFVPSPLGVPPAALVLSLDVPAHATGTGERLVLDGQDIALLRISTTDKASVLVSAVPVNVTCKVVSGPGHLVGVGAGNPASHEQPNGDIVATVGGVARCLVQVSLDCTSPARNRTISVDVDGNQRTTVLPEGSPCPEDPIVVQASSPGLVPVLVSIPTSGDAGADAPVAVASQTYFTGAAEYLEQFVG